MQRTPDPCARRVSAPFSVLLLPLLHLKLLLLVDLLWLLPCCSGLNAARERGRYSPSFSASNVRPFDKVHGACVLLAVPAEACFLGRGRGSG
jgi:hypothetical protein